MCSILGHSSKQKSDKNEILSARTNFQLQNLNNGGQTAPEDDLLCKTTFEGIQSSMEAKAKCKTTFYERQPLMEDNVLWKTCFDCKYPFMKDVR